MNKFITLTKMDDSKVVINIAHIVLMESEENCTTISVVSHSNWVKVKETMDEIKIKILDTDFTKW